MARTLEVTAPTGLTLTCDLVARGTNVITETVVMTEKSTAKQVYTGVVTAGAGNYEILYKQAATFLGVDSVKITAVDGSTFRPTSMIMLELIKDITDQFVFGASNVVNAGIVSADNIAAAVANKIADHIIRRSTATARASANGDAVDKRSLLGAISKLHNRFDAGVTEANKITVYEEDDVSIFYKQTLVTDPTAEPITSINTD